MEEPTPLVLREECRQECVIVALEGELDTVSECRLNSLVTRLVAVSARSTAPRAIRPIIQLPPDRAQ